MSYRLPESNTSYDILIENPAGKEHGVSEAVLDSRPLVLANGAARIPLVNDGSSHSVKIRL
jgi:hypothetical protein